MKFLTNGKTNFPPSSRIGDVRVSDKNYKIEVINNGKTRKIKVWIKNFSNKTDISAEFVLTDEPKESMVARLKDYDDCVKDAYYFDHVLENIDLENTIEQILNIINQ